MSTKPPTLHLEIEAVWINGKWRIVDPDGHPTKHILNGRLLKLDRLKRGAIPHEWLKACKAAVHRFNGAVHDIKGPWQKKCKSTAAMIKNRRNPKGDRRQRIVPASLEDACRHAARLLVSAGYGGRHSVDPWQRKCTSLANGINTRI